MTTDELKQKFANRKEDEAELLRFIESLWNRGLLTENPESFDYELVIWDYLKRKEK